ncbi:hypothetical protein [Polaromonas sp.]|uniref:hypothetical protein n=1 Tax=Polaromonas sp. TaxID=1869339 RepID=UPI003267D28F
MRVRIDIPVFTSPTSALGNASGEIEVTELPSEHAPFHWPAAWVTARPSYFSPDQSRVMSVAKTADLPFVLLYGIVCASEAEARECATFLEKAGELFFDEYDHTRGGRDV